MSNFFDRRSAYHGSCGGQKKTRWDDHIGHCYSCGKGPIRLVHRHDAPEQDLKHKPPRFCLACASRIMARESYKRNLPELSADEREAIASHLRRVGLYRVV